MKLLGSLGIDIKLLVAQIINFGLLLWLLKKLLYGPIVRRIEKDESEFEKVEKAKEEIKREKAMFAKQQREELRQAHSQARQIIEEAEEIAQQIKAKAKEEAQKEAKSLAAMAKNKLALEKFGLKEKMLEHIKQEALANLQMVPSKILPVEGRRLLQDAFFDNLIQELKKLNLNIENNLKNIADKLEKNGQPANSRSPSQKLLKEIIAEKLGPVMIYCAQDLSKKQQKRLEAAVKQKTGLSIPVKIAQDKTMVVGFRLEIAGFVIESSLRQIIEYGFK